MEIFIQPKVKKNYFFLSFFFFFCHNLTNKLGGGAKTEETLISFITFK